MKIRQVGAERTDRQIDMAKLIAALRNFANALQNALDAPNIFPYNSYGFTGKPTTHNGYCSTQQVTKQSCSAILRDYCSHLNLQICMQHMHI
jgi:hypothetical protein